MLVFIKIKFIILLIINLNIYYINKECKEQRVYV